MSQIMAPIDAIMREPPNVWLTSFYGFDPGNWGFLVSAPTARDAVSSVVVSRVHWS